MRYWPTDICESAIAAPIEILNAACEELNSPTRTFLARVNTEELPDRITHQLDVLDRTATLRITLLEVSHRPDMFYPAVIDPTRFEVPEFLKRRRRVASTSGTLGALSTMAKVQAVVLGEMVSPEKWVENPWVCATPAEFESKLTQILRDDAVKAVLFSVASHGREKNAG